MCKRVFTISIWPRCARMWNLLHNIISLNCEIFSNSKLMRVIEMIISFKAIRMEKSCELIKLNLPSLSLYRRLIYYRLLMLWGFMSRTTLTFDCHFFRRAVFWLNFTWVTLYWHNIPSRHLFCAWLLNQRALLINKLSLFFFNICVIFCAFISFLWNFIVWPVWKHNERWVDWQVCIASKMALEIVYILKNPLVILCYHQLVQLLLRFKSRLFLLHSLLFQHALSIFEWTHYAWSWANCLLFCATLYNFNFTLHSCVDEALVIENSYLVKLFAEHVLTFNHF